ncbi:MAG: exonuclease SbcCD subunit D C-terminal domain-containing protein, partial [Leclercia adecarboxylata]|nr:exonuclease SbcCD subunit D C-terminal domain-containing protein [Leclercia adecarboxylata]
CVHLVSFDQGKLSAVESLEVPITQPLAVLKGDLAAIAAQLEQWRGVEQTPPVWLDIEIATEEYLHDMQRKIQRLTEDLPVEVLLVRRSRELREKLLANSLRETLSELRVEEVFERRLAQETLDDAQRTRLNELFSHALHALDNEEDNA